MDGGGKHNDGDGKDRYSGQCDSHSDEFRLHLLLPQMRDGFTGRAKNHDESSYLPHGEFTLLAIKVSPGGKTGRTHQRLNCKINSERRPRAIGEHHAASHVHADHPIISLKIGDYPEKLDG